MLKVKTNQEGKTFEAFVKMIITDGEDLIALGMVGNLSTVRAIHGSLYDGYNHYIGFQDDENDKFFSKRTTRSYKRIEELNGKVCHAFLLPKMSIESEYEEELQRAEQEELARPERIVIAKSSEIEYEVGMFLANTYGLPRTRSWAEKYLYLLPKDKMKELTVQTTGIMDKEWQSVRAIRIESMSEEEVLNYIEIGIRSGILNPVTDTESKAIFTEGMKTEEYLQENALSLASHIDKYMKPQYDGTHYLQAIGETKRVSLPAQARLVMGALTVLQKQKSAFMVADMGGGKTQMSLTAAYVMMKEREKSGAKDGLRVLIVAPSIIVPKWATSEIPTILGHDIATTTLLNSTEDAIQYAQKIKKGHKVPKGKIEFVLVSTDRMKLGANKYVLSAKWNKWDNTWHCPDCNEAIISPEATVEEPDLLATWEDAVATPKEPPMEHNYEWAKKARKIGANGLPIGYVEKWSTKIRRFVCHNCAITEKDEDNDNVKILQKNHSLVRPALRSLGEDKVKPRWMIAQIFQRMLKNHFHLGIYDEIQQMKASNSGRGLSFHKLLKSTRKNLFLTGTLTNGEATSIQSTLWRSDPQSLIDDGFNHSSTDIAWAKKYGVLEKVTISKDDGIIGATTNRRKDKVILKTKPGISPRLTTRHLLHKSTFMDLGDLGLPLVKKEEIPVIIPLKNEHAEAYANFHKELYEACLEAMKVHGTGAWARFNPATLNYADQPHIEQEYSFITSDDHFIQVRADIFEEEFLTAKEEKLIGIVKENLEENRGCIVYNHYTGMYRQNERLQKILAKEGITAEILDTNVSSAKRFEWLEKQKKLGTKVLIMNMSLVQVGLDLLEWSSIIYYQLNDDINVLRQAGGRNWRIGQSRNCRIYYLVNQDTQQMAQFERLMTRRIEALLVEGRIERSSPLVQFAKENESKLARDLSHSLEASELEKTWITAAEKDIDQSVELVDENELAERIQNAFKVLTDETKKLCGVSIEEKTSNIIEFPKKVESKVEQDDIAMDLFNYQDFIVVEEVKVKKKRNNTSEQNNKVIEQFAFELF